jgi:RNA polymerase sigma-70 factor (ECF subfamily)
MFLRRARAAQAEPLGTDVAASGASQDVSLADAWRAAARDRAPRAPRAPRSRALAAAPRRTQREIGEILGISQSNVATKLSRLRAHLRGELAEEA